MQVKQLIKSSGRAAAGTLQARDHAERTLGEKLVCRTGRVEQKKKSRARCQPQPDRGRNRQLARTIARHFNKMKTCHDLVATNSYKLPRMRSIVPRFTCPKVLTTIV